MNVKINREYLMQLPRKLNFKILNSGSKKKKAEAAFDITKNKVDL